MQSRHDLTDAEWAIISPLPPDKPGAFHGWTTGGLSAGSFTSCAPARRGATFRNAAGRMRQSATAGPGKGCGSACSRRWRRARRDLFISSTPRWCAPTSTPRAEKRGSGPRHRTLARRAEHQNPRRRRRPWPAAPLRAHPGPSLRQGCRACTILKLIADHGSCPHIPTQRDRREQRSASHHLYRQRNLVERFFNKLKHFRGIATRYHKLARNFLAAIALACIRLWIKINEYTTKGGSPACERSGSCRKLAFCC